MEEGPPLEIEAPWLSRFLFATALISLLQFFVYWPAAHPGRRARVALGLHFCLAVIQFHFAWLLSLSDDFILIFRLHLPFLFWLGPLAYLYFRELFRLEREVLRGRRLALHFFPGLVVLLLLLPFYQLGEEAKFAAWRRFLIDQQPDWPDYLLLAGLAWILFYLLSIFFQAFRLLAGRVASRDWLPVTAFGILLMGLVATISPLLALVLREAVFFQVGGWILVALVGSNFVFQGRFPSFVRDVRWQVEAPPPPKTYQLDREDPRVATTLERLEHLMGEEKLYLEDDLSLPRLADQIGVPAHFLSQVINSFQGKGFYPYIHELRVREACRLMTKQPDRTILSIAYDCGFNSKSSFNTAFLKITGQTPSQFRRNLAQT